MTARIAVLIAAFLLGPLPSSAADPSPPGVVEATVLVMDREPIPGAAVTLVQVSNPGSANHFQITDASGRVRFADLDAGDYSLRVEMGGFVPMLIGPFPVHGRAGENPRIGPFTIQLNAMTWHCPEVRVMVPTDPGDR